MDRTTVDWHGPMPALVTPFDADGNIDEAGFCRNVELGIENGMTGMVVAGCTGEFWAVSNAERVRLFELCVQTAKGRATVIGGTGSIRTQDVIELTQAAKDVGCDGAMILPPYFVRPSADDIVAHYQAASDAVKIPIMLYNIPSSAVNALTPELVDRLADIENVVAIKESSADFNNFYKTLVVAGDRIHLFLGPITLYGVAALAMGASGFVDTSPNFWGKQAAELYHAAKNLDMKRAGELQKTALGIRELITGNGRNMYCGTKAVMNMLGLPGGYPRLPLRPLEEPHLSELRQILEQLGISPAKAAAE